MYIHDVLIRMVFMILIMLYHLSKYGVIYKHNCVFTALLHVPRKIIILFEQLHLAYYYIHP